MHSVIHDSKSGIPGTRKNGILFIVSAPSGAGKTTLCRAVLEKLPDLKYSISHTTRKPRYGEHNGVDYYFISKKEFEENIKTGNWLEWASVYDHYYGTSADYIKLHLAQGHSILLDIDVAGTKQILSRHPDSITIFILPPSLEVLRQRLESRGTDSAETIGKRLKKAEEEISQKNIYRHHIINDSLPEAIDQLSAIIQSYQNQPADQKR
jgi:guanylate kinase